MPHGMCYLWRPELLWTHVVSDAVIGLAYYAIPPALLVLVLRARAVARASGEPGAGLPYPWIFLAFGLFILACGTTHFMAVWTVWEPVYWLSGGVKAATAVVSAATAVALPPLIPKGVALLRSARLAEKRGEEARNLARRLARTQRIARVGGWDWDPSTDHVSTTPEARALYGVSSTRDPERLAELLGGVDDAERERLRRELGQVANRRRATVSFDHGVTVDGEARVLHVMAESGEPSQERNVVLVTSQDVTAFRESEHRRLLLEQERLARKKAEKDRERIERQNLQLEALTGELQRRNEELDHFAYVASHDLKAPLRGIGNLASWLEQDLAEHLDRDTREYLSLMRGRVQRMESLIGGLLEYSRVGRTVGTPERVDTRALMEEIVELLPVPDVLEVRIGDLPVVRGERVRLHQVLQNLVENAIRHAEQVVEVDAEVTDEGATFHVSDDGPGIDPGYQERIWEIFQRLEASDDVEGTGLGLALVRKIVEERGGRAWVDSTPGEGAIFHFTWPSQVRSQADTGGG